MPRFLSVVCFAASGLLLSCPTPIVRAQETEMGDKETGDKEISYFIGMSMGQSMRQSGFLPKDFSEKELLAGFLDGIDKKEATLSDEQLRATQQRIEKLLDERSKAPGLEFMEKKEAEPNVQKLPSGLLYKVIKSGSGGTPEATDTVKVHYTGRLIDGTVFDSSVERGEPATFPVNRVIKGWQIALQKMRVGDKWQIFIPSELAYGQMGSPPNIGRNQVLQFEVELLEIQ